MVLRPVGGITECFRTARKLTHVGFLSGVRSEVGLQILKAGIGLGAAFKLRATNEVMEVITTDIRFQKILFRVSILGKNF